MSAVGTSDPTQSSAPGTLSTYGTSISISIAPQCSDSRPCTDRITRPLASKGKKHRKKKRAAEVKGNGDTGKTNGAGKDLDIEGENGEDEEPETPSGPIQPDTPQESSVPSPTTDEQNGTAVDEPPTLENVVSDGAGIDDAEERLAKVDPTVPSQSNGVSHHATAASSSGTEARLEALARDRYALREEVAELRRSLEEIQNRHQEELGGVRDQLEEAHGEKEHAESKYQDLLGKVGTIRSQLGERLKADAVCRTRTICGISKLTSYVGRFGPGTDSDRRFGGAKR